jgi:hypothetical protein
LRSSSIFLIFFFEFVFHFVCGYLSSWVKIRLHTENQLPRLHGSALKVPLLSQAPTQVEVELGCDNNTENLRQVHRGSKYDDTANHRKVHRGPKHDNTANHRKVHSGPKYDNTANHRKVHRGPIPASVPTAV